MLEKITCDSLKSCSLNNLLEILPEVEYELGKRYYEGKENKKNMEKAFFYFNAAAEHGYVASQWMIGFMYFNGFGIDQDYTKAREIFEKLEEQGIELEETQFWLGELYEYGRGTKKDYKKACEWYEKASKQGNPVAKIRIAYLYENKIDIDDIPSELKDFRLYRKLHKEHEEDD